MKKNKNIGIKTVMTVLIALTMTSTAFISIMGVAETGNNNILTVYGTVEDEFGVPTSWFLVGYENTNTNTGKVSEFEDGKYYLEIENVSIGDVISLNFTDGKCFVHKEITVDTLPMTKELNIILDPIREKPKPANFEKPDIESIKEAMKPLNDKITLPERPEIPVNPPINENETNNTNETEPPIVLTDIRAPPLYRTIFTKPLYGRRAIGL